jgi:hypothetical protein
VIPLLLIVGFLAGAVVLSLAVDALRLRPDAPQTLYWDPAITIQYTVIDGRVGTLRRTGCLKPTEPASRSKSRRCASCVHLRCC